MTPRRPSRELGPEAAGSRRGVALALALLGLLALGALGLLRDVARAPVGPRATTQGESELPEGPTLPEPLEGGAAARSSAPSTGEQPASVDLTVRLVERVARPPRAGELRPELRGVAGLRATWEGAREASSDADGLVRFTGLVPRAGELCVEPQAALQGWCGTLDLLHPSGSLRRAGAHLTFELELRPDRGRFAGEVVDAAGRPAAGAWVALVRRASAARRTSADQDLLAQPARCDGEGRFELPLVPGEEQLELLVLAEGTGRPFGHVRALDAQEASGSRPVRVELPPVRRARVRVLGADGQPAAGRVCLRRDGARWPADLEPRLAHTALAVAARSRPRSPGELDVELADGAWVVHFLPDAPGAPRTLFQFALGPGSPSEFEFRLADRGPPSASVPD